MSNSEYYLELIQTLTTRLSAVEEENIQLKRELSEKDGKLEILYQFYSDFKHLNKTDGISDEQTNVSVVNSKQTYDGLLSEYFVTKDTDIIMRLFENYGMKTSQILTDIRNVLPSNIKEIVKKYNCENEYQIILKSIEHINKLKEKPSHSGKGMLELSDCYITNYTNDKKRTALRYLTKALIYYPFQFDKFLESIQHYRYDDLDEQIERIKFELYGEKNMLLTDRNFNIPKKKRGRKPNPNKVKLGRKKTKVVREKKPNAYAVLSISNLVENVRKDIRNPRQKALRTIGGMIKAGRSKEEIKLFADEVDKFLTKKIWNSI